MKLTKHNGRAGKNGVYNPKHNDRSFHIENSDHIDGERAKRNIYWDCYNGYRTFADRSGDEMADTFEDVEKRYYASRYRNYVEGQNARNAKNRHTERNRSTEDMLKNKKTCPEESVFQIGTMEEHVPPDVLFKVVVDFITEIDKRFGSHVHTLDWALHLDESTPHIHERHVFDCENRYGELCPQQENALEELGFELPEPDKKPGRYNNRKMVFDASCRALLFDICKNYGLHLDEEAEYGGRAYLEKQDFILLKQKERMAQQESQLRSQKEAIAVQEETLERGKDNIACQEKTIREQAEVIGFQNDTIEQKDLEIHEKAQRIEAQDQKLEELVLKIEDVETLLDEVSEAAYDRAVEVVTDQVRERTQLEDIKVLDSYQKSVTSPGAKNSPQVVALANKILNRAKEKLRESASQIIKNVQSALRKPEVRQAGKEQVKEKARESIKAKMERARITAEQKNRERREREKWAEPARKKDMEI